MTFNRFGSLAFHGAPADPGLEKGWALTRFRLTDFETRRLQKVPSERWGEKFAFLAGWQGDRAASWIRQRDGQDWRQASQ